MGALMLATALSALDANIVGTAIPTIVGQLGGLALLPWLVAAFLLPATTLVPLWGKLADLYGRKPVLLAGIAVFLIGSALCGAAGSIGALIAFRAVQGLGAGAIAPVTLTLLGDLFTVRERARMQGLFSAVWGASSVAGPLVGGLLVSTAGWPWIFFVNLPFGLAAMGLLARGLREPARSAGPAPRIDWPGAITLTLGLAALLLALSLAAQPGGLNWPGLALLAGGLGALAVCVWVERRAAEPVLPLPLLRARLLGTAMLAGFLANAVLVGSGAFLPLLVQGVWQGTPLQAGLAIAPLSIGWLLGSIAAGRLLRWGAWTVALLGAALILAGGVIWLPLGLSSPVALVPVGAGVQGIGFGLFFPALLIPVQSAVAHAQRGSVTSMFQFACNLGNTVGVTVLGAVFTSSLAARLAVGGSGAPAAGASGDQLGPAGVLLDPLRRGALDPAGRLALQTALAGALTPVLVLMAGFALLALLAAWFFPRRGPASATPPDGARLPEG